MKRQVKGIWIPIEIWENKDLTWNEKILFLEIDSFTSKDKDCYFSNEYIANLLGVTENSANRILSSLISKGYVIKTSFDGRRRFVKTAFTYDNADYSQKNKQDTQDGVSSMNNEEYIPNTSNNKEEKEDTNVSKKDKDLLFEECWALYGRRGSKGKSKEIWNKLKDDELRLIKPHIQSYIQSVSDKKYQKWFERYLRDKSFQDVVYKGNMIIFDPEQINNDGEYRPQLDGFNLMWNEQSKCYISMYDISMLFDGYNDNNRPASAVVMKNGVRYKWNTENKKWEAQ